MPQETPNFTDAAVFKHSASGFTPASGSAAVYVKSDGKLYLKDSSGNETTADIGGTTGSVDNAILRADGTGGSTSQGSAFIIADNATASPNNTVNHASIQATGNTTNVSVSIVPKGTGSFSLQVPDGTSTGGNARGSGAVDLQTSRDSATKVASGASSLLASSALCRASGQRSSCISSYFSDSASDQGLVLVGYNTTASGNGSAAIGYYALADRETILTFSSGNAFFTTGAGQIVQCVLSAKANSATAAELLTGLNNNARFTIPSGKTVSAIINIVAATSGGEFANRYVRAVTIANRGGTTALRGAVKDIDTEEQIAGCDVTISANDTNDAIRVEFSGVAPVTGCTAEADDDVISKTAHGFSNNDDIVFTSLTGGAGLTVNSVTYWVRDVTTDTFKVSATRGGAAVNITTDYTDMTASRVFRVVAHLQAVEVAFGP